MEATLVVEKPERTRHVTHILILEYGTHVTVGPEPHVKGSMRDTH